MRFRGERDNRLALYFGYGDGGHFLRGGPRSTIDPQETIPGFPWTIGHLDTGLLKNGRVKDWPTGQVHWTCGGKLDLWHAFYWWDRSGDGRPGSNSGFYVRGFPHVQDRDAAFTYACSKWPEVVTRQKYPLVVEP